MVDPPTPFHHLRCQQVGSVTIAVVGQAAFAESSHPDDWTPHLTDAVTNRELRDDLTRLAAVSPGPVVIDMRGVNMFLGDAVARLIIFARQMAEEGKPLVVCASPSICLLYTSPSPRDS